MVKIGVIGYSSGKFDERKARMLLDMALSYVSDKQGPVSIVSGLTNMGIPKLAYEWATVHGLKTVGVACHKANEYECYPVNDKILIGYEWGDESEAFLERIDCLVRVGGGEQSMKEAAEFKAMYPSATVIEFELERKD